MRHTIRPSAGRTTTRSRRHLITRAAVETCEPRRLLAVSTVTGTVWSDTNKDGVRQTGEAGLANQTVYADLNGNLAFDAGETSVKTDASGFYTLGVPLQDGKRSISVRLADVPTSRVTAPSGGGHSGKFNVVLTAGNRNFGVAPVTQPTTYVVSGTAFADFNNNGVRDAGEGLADGTVYVDYDGDGTRDADEPSAVMDMGTYALSVKPGAYEVRFLGYDAATPAGNRLFDSGSVQTTAVGAAAARFDTSAPATLTDRSVGAGIGYTLRVMTEVNVEGLSLNPDSRAELSSAYAGPYYAWRDLDADGLRDANEPTVARRTDYVDFTPAFEFAIRSGDSYRIGIATSDAVGARAVTVVSGVIFSRTEARPLLAATNAAVVGRLFYDSNGNGTMEVLESTYGLDAVAATTVYADYDNDGVLDANEPRDTVNVNFSNNTSNLTGMYVLNVQPGVQFTVRTVTGGAYSDHKQTTTPTLSVAANTYVGRNVGIAPASDPPAGPVSTVTGTVWSDTDKDGVRDSGEAGLANQTVYADLNGNLAFDAGETTVKTDASGFYSLGVPLQDGKRSISVRLADVPTSRVTAPSGGGHSGKFNVVLTAGNRNFGVAPVASQTTTISGVIFNDANFNGVRDAGEGSIAYVAGISTVYYSYLNADGVSVENTALVDSATGAYTLTRVPVGTTITLSYTAEYGGAVVDGSLLQTTPLRIGYDYSPLTVTTTSAPITNANIGFAKAGTLIGNAVRDVNDNGKADADEPAIYDNDGFWLDLDNDRVRDANEPGVPQIFRFAGGIGPKGDSVLSVPYGTYTVAYSANLSVGATAVAFASVTTSAANPNGIAGIAVPVTGPAVSGVVFEDANRNGVRDAGEGPVHGAIVYADYNNNGKLDADDDSTALLLDSESTDPTYYLPVDAGRAFTLRVINNADREPLRTTQTYAIAGLTGTQQAYGRNFANPPTAPQQFSTVTGTVWNDADKDGVRDGGEAGLANQTVYADLNGNLAYDTGETSVKTDASGFYTLGVPLQDGKRSISVRLADVPTSRVTAPSGGGHSGKFNVVLTAGNRNFGVAPITQPTYYVVSGTVFIDANRNGVQDAGEGPAVGVPVYASAPGDDESPWPYYSQVRTDAQGRFTLEVAPGTWEVHVDNLRLPDLYTRDDRGFKQTTAIGAAAARVDTNAPSTTQNRVLGAVGASVVSVQPTIELVGNPAGFPASGGTELAYRFAGPFTGWRDLDFDGVRDANEPAEQQFYQYYPDGDGNWAYKFLIADGEKFQIGVSPSGAVGATAEKLVTATGAPGVNYFAPVVKPKATAVVGRVFLDEGDGVLHDSPTYPFWFFGGDKFVYADYDKDGVQDADEPSTTTIGLYTYEESSLIGHFILYVDPNRSFTLRLSGYYGNVSQAKPTLAVAPNTFAGLYDVGFLYDENA